MFKTLVASLCLLSLVVGCATTPSAPPAAAPAVEPAAPKAPPAPEKLTIEAFAAPEAGGAVNSYVIQGATEVVVVDGQMVVPLAQALAEKIKASGKKPKAFVLTHAHPDHYFGFHALQQAFPGVPLYATPGVKAEFDAAAAGTLAAMKGMLGEGAPTGVATVTALEGALDLGGQKIELVELKGGEHTVSAIVRVPSLNAVLAGDHLYAQVHNWMKECDAKGWLQHLADWKKGAASTVYYPGHGAGQGGVELIDANIAYIEGYVAEVAKAAGKDQAALMADAKRLVLAKFPTYKAPQFLDWTLGDYLACTRPAAPAPAPAPAPKKSGKK
jgi:glyoxylase-like metal-dependent hydrolase (beta-lactamase superfamily II)